MKKLPQISEAEYEVMKIIWAKAPVNTNEITDLLTAQTDWKPKTIQTMIKRLVQKGALSYEKDGRIFVYSPLVKENEYVAHESNSFLTKYYQGNISAMVSSFLENDKLTATEIERLRSILAAGNLSEED